MTTELTWKAERQMDRAYATMHAIRDDVQAGEYDGARAHLEILRRQLSDLDEKLFQAATEQVAA